MKLTPLQRRAERKGRNQTMVDMNLVSLIDVFTILIFFLLSSASGVELLPSPKAVKLPESIAEKSPKETIVVIVSESDILVDGRLVFDQVCQAITATNLVNGNVELDFMLGQARWLNDEPAFPFVRGARPDAPGFRDVYVSPEVIVGLID